MMSHTPPDEGVDDVAKATVVLLKEAFSVGSSSSCATVLVITDALTSPEHILKEFSSRGLPWSVVVMRVASPTTADEWTGNTSLPHLIQQSRLARQDCPCTNHLVVLVLSLDLSFLVSLGAWGEQGRLLAGGTKLLVVMSQPSSHSSKLLQPLREEVLSLASQHWTYSMMNTLFLLSEEGNRMKQQILRWYNVYSYLPYTPQGGQLVKVASCSTKGHLHLQHGHSLFPSKFSNFYNAEVNITALPYKPYWTIVEDTAEGTQTPSSSSSALEAPSRRKYSGSDRLLLEALAKTLNFTIHVLPAKSWDEVVTLVEKRVSFLASVVHVILPQRLARFGFTCTYEHGINLGFAMAKPSTKPRWQALYYPLANEVWASVLLVVLLMPAALFLISRGGTKSSRDRLEAGIAGELVLGTLMGQPLSRQVPTRASSTRMLLGAWLIFAFVVGTAYRSNLIASLALPKFLPRPETLAQLVQVVSKITMPSYGSEFREYFLKSEFENFRVLGEMIVVGVSVEEGLHQASTARQSHVDGYRYIEQKIAEHFTLADGTTLLYVGKEGLSPGLNAWPLPHDAPYKASFDHVIKAVLEAGLYNKWMDQMLRQARQEGRRRRRRQLLQKAPTEGALLSDSTSTTTAEGGGTPSALTLVHLQGPLLLLLLGLGVAMSTFVGELLLTKKFLLSKY